MKWMRPRQQIRPFGLDEKLSLVLLTAVLVYAFAAAQWSLLFWAVALATALVVGFYRRRR